MTFPSRLWLGFVILCVLPHAARVEAQSKFTIIVPDKYSGWVCVHFGVSNAASLPSENGTFIIRPPARGTLQTSTNKSVPLSSAKILFERNGKRVSVPKEWRIRFVSRECPGSDACIFFGTEEDWASQQDTPDDYSGCAKTPDKKAPKAIAP